MASADTDSVVTRTANFLVVPASRKECANTNAPESKLQSVNGNWMDVVDFTWKVEVVQQQLW